MTFIVTSERDIPQIRYEKVGRLRPGDHGIVDVIKDGEGGIRTIQMSDFLLVLNGLPVPDLSLSESGNRIIIAGEYAVLVTQVRGMIGDWPKKKAALFMMKKKD